MKLSWRLLFMVGVVGLGWWGPRVAAACSCLPSGYNLAAPNERTAVVPTNTKIWVGLFDDGAIRLVDENDVEVAGSQGQIAAGNKVLVFTPAAPLRMGGRYRVSVGSMERSTFVVNAAADFDAPAPPSEKSREYFADEGGGLLSVPGDSCEDEETYSMVVELDHQEHLTVADVGLGDALDVSTVAGRVSAIDEGPRMSLGRSACGNNWPEVEGGFQGNVRFATYDLAGNFSGWNDTTSVEFPNPACTCTRVHTEAAWSSLLAISLGLTMLFFRRQTRS